MQELTDEQVFGRSTSPVAGRGLPPGAAAAAAVQADADYRRAVLAAQTPPVVEAPSLPSPAQSKPRTVWDRLPSMETVKHQVLDRGVASVIDAAGGAVGFLANGLNGAINLAVPGDPLPTNVGSGWSEALGFTPPATQAERLVKDVGVGAGAGLFTGVAAAPIAARAAPGLAGSFMQFLAEAPVVNTVAGGSGGGSAGVAREAGFGPIGQTIAGLAGGLGGGIAAARFGRARAPGVEPELTSGPLDDDAVGLTTGPTPGPGGGPRPGGRPGLPEGDGIIEAEWREVDAPSLPAPRAALPPPQLALPAPRPALPDLRGDVAPPVNSNRPAPLGRENGAETPAVIEQGQDPELAARTTNALEQIAAVLRGGSNPAPPTRSALSSSAPPLQPPTPFDVATWLDEFTSRGAPANDPPPLPTLPAPAAGIGSRAAARNSEVAFGRPVDGRVTSGFGPRASFRTDNGARASSNHKGVDYAAPLGAPVSAAADGQVVFVGNRGGYGLQVRVRHDDGTITTYSHLSATGVKQGDRVAGGTSIASVGQSGNATGPHLHFEAHRNGAAVDPATVVGTRSPVALSPSNTAPAVDPDELAANQEPAPVPIDTAEDLDAIVDTLPKAGPDTEPAAALSSPVATAEPAGALSPRPSDPDPITPRRAAANVGEARRVAREFVGQPIMNEAEQIEATLSGNNLSKMTSRSAMAKSSSPEDHLLAIANADELFRTAKLIERHPDKRGEPTIAAISRWRGMLQTADGPRSVKLTVKETTSPLSPNPLYTIETAEVEPGRIAPPESGIERAPGLDRNAPQPGSVDNVGAPPPPVERGPEDFLTFVARNGGLRDDEGHNLRGKGRLVSGAVSGRRVRENTGGRGIPQYAPGGGHIFRANGRTIDELGEIAHEAGFFPHGRPTTAEVLDMLDRSTTTRVYRPADEAIARDQAIGAVDDAERAAAMHAVDEAASAYGIELTADERVAIARIATDFDGDAVRAIDQYYIDRQESGLQSAYDETNDPAYGIPFSADEQAATPRNPDPSWAEGARGPEGVAGDEGGPGAIDGSSAENTGLPRPEQRDAFGQRPGDERRALELRTEGRQRSGVTQKPPGSDGGLFDDTGARQPDLLDAPAKPERMTPAERARRIRNGELGPDGEAGFITPDMLLAPFRAAGKMLGMNGTQLRQDAAALTATMTRAFGNPKAALRGTVDRLKTFAEPALYSADGTLRSMADRLGAPTIAKVADLFHARAGEAKGVDRTYHEAVDIEGRTRTQQVYDVLKPFMGDKDALGRIRDLLATPRASVRATAAERAAAGDLRDLLKDALEYRRDAGEDLGEVLDGYFPRVIDAMKVAKDPTGFERIAEQLYRAHGASDPASAAKAWSRNIQDSYAGLDGGYDQLRAGSAPNSAKERAFGKAADAALTAFYKQDVFDTLATYMLGSARRAEETRRFGLKGRQGSAERAAWVKAHNGRNQWAVMMDSIKDELRASGGDVDDVPREVLALRDVNLGRLYRPTSSTISVLHAWNQLSVMDRATVSSLGDLAMGFVRGGPRYGFQHLGTSLAEFARDVTGRPDSQARRYAEALGVANDAFGTALLHSRADGGNVRGKAAEVSDAFYRAIGLQQLTDAGRVAATKTGQRFLHDLAHDLTIGGRTEQRARFYLRELGVKDPAAFGTELRNGAPTADDLLARKGGFASDYATALMRYVNQSILMPSRAERPKWAQHPVGSLFFALQSYSYGFGKNVVQRQARLAGAAVRERDPRMLASASGLLVLAGLTYINDTFLRPALFGSRYDFDGETPVDTALRVADRAGVLGPASQLVNMFKGLKYQREPTSALAGPVIGRLADGAYRAGKLAFYNSENTNTDERNAAGALYDLVVEPTLDFAATRYLRGIGRTAAVEATGNRGTNGALPSDREAFVSSMAGEKAE